MENKVTGRAIAVGWCLMYLRHLILAQQVGVTVHLLMPRRS